MKRIVVMLGIVAMVMFSATKITAADALGVSLGGVKLEPTPDGTSFTTSAAPVASDAELALDIEPQMVIINVFQCDEKGNVKSDAIIPFVIMIQNGNKTTLDQSVDKKKLAPGDYIMNILAGGKTVRAKFVVK